MLEIIRIICSLCYSFAISNFTKLEFNSLDISGNDYLAWILDAEIHHNAMDLGDTIKEGKKSSE